MQHQQILDLLFLMGVVLCLSGVCYGAVRDEVCDSQNTCFGGTTCDNGTCVCDLNTHYYLNSACSTKLALGTECPSGHAGADGFVCADDNAECGDGGTGINCMCKDTHYNNGGTCILKITHGSGTCQSADQCNTTGAVCSDSDTCLCNTTTSYHDSTLDACLTFLMLGDSCSTDDECSALNSVCSSGTCRCHDNFFAVLPNACESRILGETCQRTTQCAASHSECLVVCQCSQGYYPASPTSCEKRGHGETCDDSAQCMVTNSECRAAVISQMCTCQAGYVQTSHSSCEIVMAPETPKDFAVVASSIYESSVTLSWAPGHNGGLPQTFTLQYRQKDSIGWRSINQISENKTSYNLDGLRSGIKYVSTIYSKNDIGWSSTTIEVEFTTKPPQLDPCPKVSDCSVAMVGGVLGSVALIAIIIAVVLLVLLLRQREGPKRNVESETAVSSTQASNYEVMSTFQNKTEKSTPMNTAALKGQDTAQTYSGLEKYGNFQNTYDDIHSACS